LSRMGSTEKFCLRWNDFESNISVAFRDIREEKDFFDCTLSCGSKQIQAHKLILSACSPFFRSVLKQNPHQHPLLYLKGVQFTDLQAVLNFMYHGEVNVAQEELNSFLAVAEDLEVKGLTQNNSSNPKPRQDQTQSLNPPSCSKPKLKDPEPPAPPKRPRPPVSQPSYQQPDDDDILEVLPTVKTEPVTPTIPYQTTIPTPTLQSQAGGMDTMDTVGMQVTSMEESYGDDGFDYGGYEGDGHGYDGIAGLDSSGLVDQSKGFQDEAGFDGIVYEDGTALCNLCGKTFSRKYECARHMKTVHAEPSKLEKCYVCHKNFKNLQCLKAHMRGSHSVYCPKQN